MKTRPKAMSFALAATFALPCAYLAAGCGSGSHSGGGGGGGTGTVNVQVTDAPYPYGSISSAKVTVTDIELQGSGSQGFVKVYSGSTTVDLMNLQNGVTALLASSQVPAGSYSQMRVVISSGQVTLTDGRSFTLNAPSASNAGLKVFVSPALTVTSGVSSDLLLDVNLAQSFEAVPNGATQAANISTFLFHPVVRCSNQSTVGRIQGHVTAHTGGAAISGATVTVSQSGSALATAQSATDGSYVVLGLAPGSYDVTGEAVGFIATTVAAQPVAAGSETTVDLSLGP